MTTLIKGIGVFSIFILLVSTPFGFVTGELEGVPGWMFRSLHFVDQMSR